MTDNEIGNFKEEKPQLIFPLMRKNDLKNFDRPWTGVMITLPISNASFYNYYS